LLLRSIHDEKRKTLTSIYISPFSTKKRKIF